MPIGPRFIFYGGKGGVGKTTCAAARAAAEAADGRRVLVASTDPAHSLADAFGRPLAPRVRTIARRLDTLELDAPRAFARWLARHRPALVDILEHGTWLDRRDAESLLELPIPGVDELVGLLELSQIARATAYDDVIVDTAPTGHALRLLTAPAAVTALAGVLDALEAPHRTVRERFGRAAGADRTDDLIARLAADAAAMTASLRDAHAATFAWVTLPERLSIAESQDAIAALGREGLRVSEIVVNQVIAAADACRICGPRQREEARLLDKIRRSLAAGRRLTIVPALTAEPRGPSALRQIGGYLLGTRAFPRSKPRPLAPARSPRSAPDARTVPPESIAEVRDARLIFVGGKGGVGKTTVAAALALRLAAARPRRSVLLLSVDPAHSIADVLAAPVGHRPVRVPGTAANFAACELDAVRAFRQERTSIEAALKQVAVDSDVAAFDVAPPGIDELFGLIALIDARAAHDVIVVDTAPTGHALRLLALPDQAHEWTKTLMRLLLKYRDVVRPGPLGERLVAASRSIRELQSTIRDPRTTRFVVVTRAARLPIAETVRLLTRLRALEIATAALVFNARTLDPGGCRRCRAIARAERRQMAAMRMPRDCAIIQTPLVAPPPRGPAALRRWARTWTNGES